MQPPARRDPAREGFEQWPGLGARVVGGVEELKGREDRERVRTSPRAREAA